MTWLLRRRLMFRVILNGIILLVVSAGCFIGLATILIGGPARQSERTITAWLASGACRTYAQTPVADVFAKYPIGVIIYSNHGEQLASSTLERSARLATSELAQAASGNPVPLDSTGQRLYTCADGSGRYVSVGGPLQKPGLSPLFISVAAVVLLVAIGSIPLARSLVKPLRQLVATATRFGEGDLSARAQFQRSDEIGDLAQAFNAMAAKLEARRLAEKEMLANISHELRTPLARVRVVLEMAKEDPARAAVLLAEISRDLTELERLTNDVLTAMRLDFESAHTQPSADPTSPHPANPDTNSPHVNLAPGLRLRPAQVDVAKLLRESIAHAVEAHPDRDFVLEAPDDLPGYRGDPALLRRLFDNLIDNARKYSRDSVVVRARSERLPNGNGNAVVVEVEDTGIGIDRTDLERIFEPFFRTDRSRQRLTGGTGLGLALCKRIVELHHGSIRAESGDGKTTITVRLAQS